MHAPHYVNINHVDVKGIKSYNIAMSEDDFYKTIGYDPETKRPIGEPDPFANPKSFHTPAPAKPKPKREEPGFIEVTVHKFKSNIAHYIRECERGRIKGVVIKRYNECVGFYAPWKQGEK